jgi:peroxiredoxin Q/BCP
MTLLIKDTAPDFTVSIGNSSVFSLKNQRGKNVILYFYPKDSTPGCTQEACDFKEAFQDFREENTVIIGLSKDSIKSHLSFSEKYGLPFYLGSDPDGNVLEKYGVWIEKSMYGRSYMGIERATFLIDGNGKIEKIWRKVKVKNHVQEILNTIKVSL